MPLRNIPIQRKLVSFIFLTSCSVLLASYLVLLVYETRSSKTLTTRNLSTIGDIIASNTTAALIYDDPKLAKEILNGLRAEPDIAVAALFDKNGQVYATYPNNVEPAQVPLTTGPDGATFTMRSLTLVQPVQQGENRVGTLYLRSDLGAMYRRLTVYGFILLGVLAGSGVLAFFLSNFFQKQISQPILDLTETAKVVSERKDYSVRAKKTQGDELGFLTEAFNAMLDQIERNHAALGESEERFRVVADSAPVLIWISDANQSCTWFNKHWLEFVGRPLEKEAGRGWLDHLHYADRERCLKAFDHAFVTRTEFRMEYRLRRRDGVYRWIFDHGVPRYRGNEFLGYIGSCVDIHDRKEAEAAVRSSELQMRLVTDHASVMLCQLDQEQRFKFVNRAYAERYGHEPSEIVGKHISEIVGTQAYGAFKGWIESALQGRREEFEVEAFYEVLGARWVHLVCVPERDVDGRVVGLVAVLTDTTRRRQAEKELERARDEAVAASRAKDDFLAALSHELRTPLSPVLLLASDAAVDPQIPADSRAVFETIRKNVELEARLIDDLLDLTSVTRGKLVLDLRPVDAHVVVRDALDKVRSEIAAKEITLSVNLDSRRAAVLGDPVRLQQVFWNVLKNAVKFTPEHGRISVTTELSEEEGMFALRVTDTGIGMTDAELNRVFEAFAQGDHAGGSGSHRFGGLGLGLAISRKVMELHFGEITVVSGGRNRGCTFSVKVPRLSESAGAVRIPEETPPSRSSDPFVGAPGTRGAILLVEDHAPTRATVEQLLRRRHYRVVSAASVEEARSCAAREKIDFVVSDIGLPDGTGYELMADLKQRYGLKGIALTGYGMEGDIAQSQIAGFVIHLIKPVRVQLLDDALMMIARWPEVRNV